MVSKSNQHGITTREISRSAQPLHLLSAQTNMDCLPNVWRTARFTTFIAWAMKFDQHYAGDVSKHTSFDESQQQPLWDLVDQPTSSSSQTWSSVRSGSVLARANRDGNAIGRLARELCGVTPTGSGTNRRSGVANDRGIVSTPVYRKTICFSLSCYQRNRSQVSAHNTAHSCGQE